MKKALLPPLAALAAGAAGFFLRRWELASAFEADTGLPIPGAPASLVLFLFSLLAVLGAGLTARRLLWGRTTASFHAAFFSGESLFITCDVIAAALLIGGGGFGVWNYVNSVEKSLFSLLLAGLLVLSGVSVGIVGRQAYRNEGDGKYNAFLLLPAFTFCLWLILSYQNRAGDPIILDYVYHILAIITTLLALYRVAGHSFDKGQTRTTLWFSLMAVYFSCVSLADGHEPMVLCLLAFAIVYCGAHSAVLLWNLTAEKEATPDEQE